MILYNTTFVIEPAVKETFLCWVKETLIPAAIESGCFFDPLTLHILPPEGETPEAESFAVQFKSDDFEAVKEWDSECFPELFVDLAEDFPQAILPFSTFMEII